MAPISRAGAARLTNHRAREAEVLSGNDGGLSVGEVKWQARDPTHRFSKARSYGSCIYTIKALGSTKAYSWIALSLSMFFSTCVTKGTFYAMENV